MTPAAGESVTEGTILEWHVKVGDPIKVDETIVEISTDKVDVELPSPASGTVSEILVAGGRHRHRRPGDRAHRGRRSGSAIAPRPPRGRAPRERTATAAPTRRRRRQRRHRRRHARRGESVTEGTILEWHVKVGEQIKVDDTIVEISTDKVDVELPAPRAARSEILVARATRSPSDR